MPSENLKAASHQTFQELWRDHGLRVEHLYNASGAERWGVTRAAFAEALIRSAAKRFGDTPPSAADAASYLESLHLQDLALACGCVQGNPQAWEYFFENYREVIYASARAVVGRASLNEARARDLADSLYAELYAGNLRADARSDGARRSLFGYFHGRSKLATWLRAVLAQRHVDALRIGGRTESLDQAEHGVASDGDGRAMVNVSAARFTPPDPDRERILQLMQEALVSTLSALPPRDRLRMALYYVRDLTLAQIGRMLGEHEATVSRRLERTRTDVRRRVEQSLRDGKHLSEAEICLCFSAAQNEWPFDLTQTLGTEASLESPGRRSGVAKRGPETTREPQDS